MDQRDCKHVPMSPWTKLLRVEAGAEDTCSRCSQPIRFKGRARASFIWLAVSWCATFAVLCLLLQRASVARTMMWSIAGASVLVVPVWAAISTKYGSIWEITDARGRRKQRFHADLYKKDGNDVQ